MLDYWECGPSVAVLLDEAACEGRFGQGCEHEAGCADPGAAAAARGDKADPGHGLFLEP